MFTFLCMHVRVCKPLPLSHVCTFARVHLPVYYAGLCICLHTVVCVPCLLVYSLVPTSYGITCFLLTILLCFFLPDQIRIKTLWQLAKIFLHRTFATAEWYVMCVCGGRGGGCMCSSALGGLNCRQRTYIHTVVSTTPLLK